LIFHEYADQLAGIGDGKVDYAGREKFNWCLVAPIDVKTASAQISRLWCFFDFLMECEFVAVFAAGREYIEMRVLHFRDDSRAGHKVSLGDSISPDVPLKTVIDQ